MVNLPLSTKCIKKQVSLLTHKAKRIFKKEAIKPLSECVPLKRSTSTDNTTEKQTKLSQWRQKKFSKYFPQVGDENIFDSSSCVLVGESLVEGCLYVTENYVAFHSKISRGSTKLLVPLGCVVNVEGSERAVRVHTERTVHTFHTGRDARPVSTEIIARLRSRQVHEDGNKNVGDSVNSERSKTTDCSVSSSDPIAKPKPAESIRRANNNFTASIVRAVLMACVTALAASGALMAARIWMEMSIVPLEDKVSKLSKWQDTEDIDTADKDLYSLLNYKLILLDEIHQALEKLSNKMLSNITAYRPAT